MQKGFIYIFLYITRFVTLLFFQTPKVVSAKVRKRINNRSNIIRTIDGGLAFPNGKWAIFLIWQPKKTPWYVKNALEALAECNINVLLVVNHELSEERLSELKGLSKEVMIRNNVGFDIGGFQDATIYLHARNDITRLMYMNDSVYYFRHGLSNLFERMSSSKFDVCSAFENWEKKHHFQSFCFSVSHNIIANKKFYEFWKSYLPVNSRVWAIDKGEIQLSSTLIAISESFEVVYNVNSLRKELENLNKNDAYSINKGLPRYLRISDLNTTKKITFSHLVDEVCDRISYRSQIHTGGFLYRQFMNNPLIKRDLVYRLQYHLSDIEYLLTEIDDEGRANEILTDMRKKGVGTELTGWKRRKFNAGII